MAKTALIEHRPWLLASVVASIAYYLLSDNPFGTPFPAFGGVWLILLKGAGVALLAAYALRRAHCLDGKILALVLALSAAADMALEIEFAIGGALFAASHAVAIILYLRNRREQLTGSQLALAAALLIATPAISYLLSERVEVAAYAVTLGLMAAAAWTSRFPRYRVGIGAVLFVVSDWLIFSDMGRFDLGILPALLVWPLYYGGQLMIATGVVQTLRGEPVAE
ncbi:lysoplasmalogenase family protein [uncultured Erythrobacter sp.]|uniref:lysoplasmalogenase family protein n=1 Tax=uncultured Erythrobacter sp. TaxID=263913 RepID=UPI00262D4EBD|nr:lysoplasmalogenase family protein [uncultured Erythrobacter sp.]